MKNWVSQKTEDPRIPCYNKRNKDIFEKMLNILNTWDYFLFKYDFEEFKIPFSFIFWAPHVPRSRNT